MKCPKCGIIGFTNEQFDFWIVNKVAARKICINLECRSCGRHDEVVIDMANPNESLLDLFPQWFGKEARAIDCND